MSHSFSLSEVRWMRDAISLAKRAYGLTSPNPMVGAVLVKDGTVIGKGYHHKAGQPHAEINALKDAARKGASPKGAMLLVTLEPCSSHGRTPPCTEAIKDAGIAEIVVAATDPNPLHAGRGLEILRVAGIKVRSGLLEKEATELNEAFNQWIVHRTPFVTVKSAMSMDGKIATAAGESKWITSEAARAAGMKLRFGSDAILVGIQTVLADDPALTIRNPRQHLRTPIRRFILDSEARTPLNARMISDEHKNRTTVIVSESAPSDKVIELEKAVTVWRVPRNEIGLDLNVIVQRMGAEQVTSLLVEGGGEAISSFFAARLVQRVYFFYAPKIIGGRSARKSVGGNGFSFPGNAPRLESVRWRTLSPDLLLTAKVSESEPNKE